MSSQDNNGASSKEMKNKIANISPKHIEPQKTSSFSSLSRPTDLAIYFLSETFATGLLVFIGCMGCIDGFEHKPSHLSISLAFGFAVMLCLNVFGMVSGAQMNPAITLAAYVYKRVDLPMAFVYVVGQLLGGFLGYGLLRVVTPDHFFENDKFCVSAPSKEISLLQGFFVEFIISVILILMCCGVWDPRQAKFHDSVPLRFGLVVTMLALVGGPYSGGSMNPARSLGPALYNWNFENHWIYWVAPFGAAIITSVGFRLIFWKEDPEVLAKKEEQLLNSQNARSNEVDQDV